jgi:hypothetical protein
MATLDNSTALDERPIRSLVADDHPVIRKKVRTVLESHPRFDVCAEMDLEAENGSIDVGGRLPNLTKCNGTGNAFRCLNSRTYRTSKRLTPGFGAGRKPPQHFLRVIALFLAVKVASTLTLCHFLPNQSSLLVEAGFADNTFGHGMILRQDERGLSVGEVTNKSNDNRGTLTSPGTGIGPFIGCWLCGFLICPELRPSRLLSSCNLATCGNVHNTSTLRG